MATLKTEAEHAAEQERPFKAYPESALSAYLDEQRTALFHARGIVGLACGAIHNSNGEENLADCESALEGVLGIIEHVCEKLELITLSREVAHG